MATTYKRLTLTVLVDASDMKKFAALAAIAEIMTTAQGQIEKHHDHVTLVSDDYRPRKGEVSHHELKSDAPAIKVGLSEAERAALNPSDEAAGTADGSAATAETVTATEAEIAALAPNAGKKPHILTGAAAEAEAKAMISEAGIKKRSNLPAAHSGDDAA